MAKILYLLSFLLWISPLHVSADERLDLKRAQVSQTYLSQVGVTESGPNNHGPEIKKYLASTNLNEGFAWCAAFVKWVFKENNISTEGATAWSPSWFPKSKIIFHRSNAELKKPPEPGDLFAIYYANLRRIGHVGFIHEWGEAWVLTVEGNTNGDGSREGDGVYKKKRLRKQIYAVSDWITSH